MGKAAVDKASYEGQEPLASRASSSILSASTSTCKISHSENAQGSDSLKMPSTCEDPQMHHDIGISDTALKDEGQDVLFSQDEYGAVVMGSDHLGDAIHKNIKHSADSISSNSGEAILETAGFSGKVDPSETPAFRDEGAPSECSVDRAASSSTKMSDLHNINNKFTEDGCIVVKPETESNVDTSNRSMPVTYAQEPLVQDHALPDNNLSDELVDVRVCDICGDVGREALLALCSECSDGAEHIYCMRIKMDQVPELDWVCEDCILVQEPKRLKLTEVDGSGSNRNPPNSEGISQGSPKKHPRVWHVDESKSNHSSERSCLSAKRPAPDSVLKSALKRRAIAKGIQPLTLSHSGKKTPLTQISSLNIMRKSKDGSPRVSSLGNQLTTEVVESTSPLSDHQSPKPWSDNEIRPAPKNVNLEKSSQPLKLPGSRGKAMLTRVSSSKITNNGKGSYYRASSLGIQSAKRELEQEISLLGQRSPKPEQRFQALNPSSVPGGKSQLTRVSSLRIMDKDKGAHFQAFSLCIKSPKKDMERECLPAGPRSPKPEPQIRSSSISQRKSQFTRVSSFKILDKGKGGLCQETSFIVHSARKVTTQESPLPGHRSPKHKPERHAGAVSKIKPISVADSNVEVRLMHDDTGLGRTVKGSANHELKKFDGMKLCKSMSFSGLSSVSAAVSNRENLRYGSERNSNKKRSAQMCLPVDGFDSIKSKPSEAKMIPEIIDRPHSSSNDVKNIIGMQVNENSDLKALGPLVCGGESFENGLGKSAQKADLGCPSRGDGSQVVASNKVLQVDLHDMGNSLVLAPADHTDVAPSGISAVPESECIWKGAFQLEEGDKLPNYCYGIQAHLSTCASSKVLDLVTKFYGKLVLKEVPRLDTWPVQFQKNSPTEQDIAVYFFAEDFLSHARSYTMLVEGMIRDDLALEANFDGVQLLVFPSSILPVRSQRWNDLLYLWGVFRVRKVGHHYLHASSMSAATLNEGLCTPITSGTKNRTLLCASKAGSLSASHTPDNSIKGPESVNPTAQQSSSSMQSMDQSCEHEEVSSVAKYLGPRRPEDLGNDYVEETFPDSTPHNNDFKKEDVLVGYGNLETPIFPFGWSEKDRLVSVSKFWQEEKTLDVISPTSFSIDSGPSGSSDGAGCAKSDEGQVDQFQDPSKYKALNLDLCLRPMSESGGHINLDLVLGSPSSDKYTERFSNDINSEHGNVSLFLSLGLPCSNG